MPVSSFISWVNAPEDPAEEALYRISQLETRFIEHIVQNDIRQQFLLNLIKTLVQQGKITPQDLTITIAELKQQNQQHLRSEDDGSTMEQEFINDIISELTQLNIGFTNPPHEPK